MKNTSENQQQTEGNINLVQAALAALTIVDFVNMPKKHLRQFASLLKVAQSDDTFLEAFPKKAVLEYHLNVDALGRPTSAHAASIGGDDVYADWCHQKLRQKMENFSYKLAQMLEGKTFHSAEIDAEKMQVYQELYEVVSNSGKTLADIRSALVDAEAKRQQQ